MGWEEFHLCDGADGDGEDNVVMAVLCAGVTVMVLIMKVCWYRSSVMVVTVVMVLGVFYAVFFMWWLVMVVTGDGMEVVQGGVLLEVMLVMMLDVVRISRLVWSC